MMTSDNKQRLTLIVPFIGRLSLGFFIMLVTIIIQLGFPKAISYFIDHSLSQQNTAWLTTASIGMLLVFVVYCTATALRYYLFESTGTMIVTDIRRRLYSSIILQEIGFFDNHKVGELSSRLSADVEVLKHTLSMSIAIAVRSLLIFLGGVVMLFTLSPKLSIIILIVIPVSILLGKWLGQKARVKSKTLQQSFAQGVQTAQEDFSNIRLIHAFNQHKKATENYDSTIVNILKNSLDNTKLFAVFQGLSTFISYSFVLVTIWFGGKLVVDQMMTIGELTSFVLYAGMVSGAASAVSGFWGEWMSSYGATERVFELINRVPDFTKKNNDSNCVTLNGEIQFDKVSFSYPARLGQMALSSFNLKINVGEKIAIVGPSGAGKTTIANLLLGFYEPTQGCIKFDGIESTLIGFDDIRKAIAIVEQEPTLFSGTIKENIGYAVDTPEINSHNIETAAKLANAHEFISAFPSGYQTIVGERGVQLSGGQKQRIAIARAVLKDPKILILDEATSALDSESENQVQEALSRLMQGRTTIMIAHRYSTIAKADKLVVMDKGEIIQYGDHKQLYNDEGSLYHKLMANQIQSNLPETIS